MSDFWKAENWSKNFTICPCFIAFHLLPSAAWIEPWWLMFTDNIRIIWNPFPDKKNRLPNICKFRSIIDIRNEIVCIKDILLMVHSDFSFFYFQRTLCKRQKVSFKTLKLYLNCGHLMSNANILIPNYTYHNLKFLPMMLCSFWVNILTVIEQKAMLFKTLKLKISNFWYQTV